MADIAVAREMATLDEIGQEKQRFPNVLPGSTQNGVGWQTS
jgi:hypothetical protein